MWMYVRPASANLLLEVERPSDDAKDPAKRKEYISFQVLPTAEANHLDLDTGEIFQDYNYARIHNKHDKLISARLIVEPVIDDSDYKRNRMRYSDAVQGEFDSFPATIFFSLCVEPATFRELADNVKHGLLPETITVGFERDPLGSVFQRVDNPEQNRPLEYGWEPDGSGMVWHNKERENRAIPIENVKFDYAVLKPRYDLTTNQLLPMMPDLPPVRTNEQIASIQIMLVEMSKHLRWAALGIIVVAVMIAIWMVRHT
jgi:hypothetical protein